MSYDSIDEIKAANEDGGFYYFTPETMGFFNSEIESDVIAGRFFITSERREPEFPKQYTIRLANEDGSIEDVGEFQDYDDLDNAERALRTALATGAKVCFDPYPTVDVTEETAPEDHYHWRAYLGLLPIGPRTTKADAAHIAGLVTA